MQHIGRVWLSPKQVDSRRGTPHISRKMFRLIEAADNNWSQKPASEQRSSEDVSDFSAFPPLEKYLDRIRFKPATRIARYSWIGFPSSGGFYSPNECWETLERPLLPTRPIRNTKTCKRTSVLIVYLLVHYDFKAFAYNTPFDAPIWLQSSC